MTAVVCALAPTTPKAPTFTVSNPLPPQPGTTFMVSPTSGVTPTVFQYAYPG